MRHFTLTVIIFLHFQPFRMMEKSRDCISDLNHHIFSPHHPQAYLPSPFQKIQQVRQKLTIGENMALSIFHDTARHPMDLDHHPMDPPALDPCHFLGLKLG
jgi:hypothetical protein